MKIQNKFKDFEFNNAQFLPRDKYVVIRLDGRAFHTFTKDPSLNLKRPYDFRFVDAMDYAAEMILKDVLTDAQFVYVQSDEMSIVFKTTDNTPFRKQISKLLTLSASMASAAFNSKLSGNTLAIFDARIAYIGSAEDILDYLNWRRLDAYKNMISNAANEVYSSKELLGKTTKERTKLLENTPYEQMPSEVVWGRFVFKQRYEYYSEDGNEIITRTRIVKKAATKDYTFDFIGKLISKELELEEFNELLNEI